MSDTISVTEFKAKCLDILGQISRHEVERLVITKRGKPVAMVVPPPAEAGSVESLYGLLKGTVIIPPDFDLTEPVLDEPFDAELGILHR
jgi:antitoxin (DNA-binding transcriptional repressor) of toxin-antitoxin stability system